MCMKKSLLTLLLPMMIYANPTSGWYEDYSYGDTTGDFSTFPYVLLLLAIFLGPYFISSIIDFFKSKPHITINTIENKLDTEEDIGKAKEKMLKGFNPAFVEKNELREFNNIDNNKKRIFNIRGYFYISIILILLVALWFLNIQFPKYMTYECGIGENKEVVVRVSDSLIRNKTTGRNAYGFPDSSNDEFAVYILWQSITGEGYMYKKDTKELGQFEPKQLCVYIGERRFKKSPTLSSGNN